jgi:hypothetical protein
MLRSPSPLDMSGATDCCAGHVISSCERVSENLTFEIGGFRQLMSE